MSANDWFFSFFLIAPELDSLLHKVASLQTCNFIKKRLQQSCFPVKFLKTPILKNIWKRLLL